MPNVIKGMKEEWADFIRGPKQKSHPSPGAGQTPIFSVRSLQEYKSEACDEELVVVGLRMTEGNQSSSPWDKLSVQSQIKRLSAA